jgi:hypothetical protein
VQDAVYFTLAGPLRLNDKPTGKNSPQRCRKGDKADHDKPPL